MELQLGRGQSRLIEDARTQMKRCAPCPAESLTILALAASAAGEAEYGTRCAVGRQPTGLARAHFPAGKRPSRHFDRGEYRRHRAADQCRACYRRVAGTLPRHDGRAAGSRGAPMGREVICSHDGGVRSRWPNNALIRSATMQPDLLPGPRLLVLAQQNWVPTSNALA